MAEKSAELELNPTWRGKLFAHFKAFSWALLFVVLAINAFDIGNRSRQALTDVTSWINITSLNVPDFITGEDPQVDFQRDVYVDVSGTWLVELVTKNRLGRLVTECEARGNSNYTINEQLPDDTPLFEWFMYTNPSCKSVPPDDYFLRVTWEFCRTGWECKPLVVNGNWFTMAEP